VVDPITLLSVLAAIAAVTLILRQAVINKITMGRRRRSSNFGDWQRIVMQGNAQLKEPGANVMISKILLPENWRSYSKYF
jgi:hypothetical protein